MSTFDDQLEKIKTAPGFIAALDQSGGSTPRALAAYGIGEDEWDGEDEKIIGDEEADAMVTRNLRAPWTLDV